MYHLLCHDTLLCVRVFVSLFSIVISVFIYARFVGFKSCLSMKDLSPSLIWVLYSIKRERIQKCSVSANQFNTSKYIWGVVLKHFNQIITRNVKRCHFGGPTHKIPTNRIVIMNSMYSWISINCAFTSRNRVQKCVCVCV